MCGELCKLLCCLCNVQAAVYVQFIAFMKGYCTLDGCLAPAVPMLRCIIFFFLFTHVTLNYEWHFFSLKIVMH